MMELDLALLRFFNGSQSLFLDGVMVTLTSGFTWIPLYIALIGLVIRNNDTMRQIMLVIGCAALCVLTTSIVTELIVKPAVGRMRPGSDPLIKYSIDVVNGLRSRSYSFFSAHASNTFGIALFVSLFVRSRLFTVAMVLWSLLNCYTRMYLGLHYPSDILCGLCFGTIVAVGSYTLFRRYSTATVTVSSSRTSTGYAYRDIDMVLLVMVMTLLYAILKGLLNYE